MRSVLTAQCSVPICRYTPTVMRGGLCAEVGMASAYPAAFLVWPARARGQNVGVTLHCTPLHSQHVIHNILYVFLRKKT